MIRAVPTLAVMASAVDRLWGGDGRQARVMDATCAGVHGKTSGTPWRSRYSDSPSSEGHVEVAK